MDLDKIIQKAQEEKAKKSKRESEKKIRRLSLKESALVQWYNSKISYRIFRKINYRKTTWAFVLSLALAFTCYIVPFDDLPEDSMVPGLLILFSILLIILFFTLFIGIELYTLIRYPNFKKIPSSLGFEFEGWENAIAQKDFLDFENWWIDCFIDIELTESSQTNPKAVEALQALCFLKAKKCNGLFYLPFLSEQRTPWTITNELRMSGSANVYVLGILYTFLNLELKPFHKHTNLIKKITLKGSDTFTHVSRETAD